MVILCLRINKKIKSKDGGCMCGVVKKIFLFAVASITLSVHAYSYRFINETGKNIEMAFQLAGINEPIETVMVPAKQNDGKPGVATRAIGGWRVGLCLKGRDNFGMRVLPDGKGFRPLLLQAHTSEHEEFLETRRVPSNVFNKRRNITPGDMETVAYRTNQLMLCFDRTFTIVETVDGHFIIFYE
jgi:hypothetical protein